MAEADVLASEGAIASIAGVALGTGDKEEQCAAQYESHLLRHRGRLSDIACFCTADWP